MRVALLRDQLEEEIDKLRGLKLSADNLDNQNQEKGTVGGGMGDNCGMRTRHFLSSCLSGAEKV